MLAIVSSNCCGLRGYVESRRDVQSLAGSYICTATTRVPTRSHRTRISSTRPSGSFVGEICWMSNDDVGTAGGPGGAQARKARAATCHLIDPIRGCMLPHAHCICYAILYTVQHTWRVVCELFPVRWLCAINSSAKSASAGSVDMSGNTGDTTRIEPRQGCATTQQPIGHLFRPSRRAVFAGIRRYPNSAKILQEQPAER